MGVYWLDVFLPKHRKRNYSLMTTEIRWLWLKVQTLQSQNLPSNRANGQGPWSTYPYQYQYQSQRPSQRQSLCQSQ